MTGATRSAQKIETLTGQGADAIVVDVFDRAALRDAAVQAHPDVVIHQLTDLPQVLDPPERRGEALRRNARLRMEGTANLVAAAQAAGARRLIAQSIAFIYARTVPSRMPRAIR